MSRKELKKHVDNKEIGKKYDNLAIAVNKYLTTQLHYQNEPFHVNVYLAWQDMVLAHDELISVGWVPEKSDNN